MLRFGIALFGRTRFLVVQEIVMYGERGREMVVFRDLIEVWQVLYVHVLYKWNPLQIVASTWKLSHGVIWPVVKSNRYSLVNDSTYSNMISSAISRVLYFLTVKKRLQANLKIQQISMKLARTKFLQGIYTTMGKSRGLIEKSFHPVSERKKKISWNINDT